MPASLGVLPPPVKAVSLRMMSVAELNSVRIKHQRFWPHKVSHWGPFPITYQKEAFKGSSLRPNATRLHVDKDVNSIS